MKSRILGLGLVSLLAFCAGCWEKSVYPFYKEGDVVSDSALVGSWIDPKEKESDVWTFTRANAASAYQLTVKSKSDTYSFDCHLFKLGTNRFMDLYSRNRTVSDIPTHHLLRVTKLGSSFEFRALDSDNVKKYLQAHPNEVAYVAVPDPERPEDAGKTEFVLAANTDALQTFVRKHLDEADFFTDTTEFTRQDAK